MSSVDNRIVKMTFDNKQFQEGIQESLESLQRFEASLDTRELEKKFDLSPITKSLQHITNLFDPLAGAAERAFIRVTDAAVNAGAKMLKSLTVDNITAGFEKFGQKTTSVGTLIAQGYDIDTVTEELERLNWFTDETSYNFTDMVENIGKFTASGKKLDESVTAMEGIATWAALSGQNANTASRAMYQISQAMGAGVMRREDFKSIQNASMDTQEFRQHALDAAVALKTLQKNTDGTYQSLVEGAKVEKFTIDQFANNLTDGLWFTDEVMMRVFNDYSAGVGQIYDYTQETGDTASEAIEKMGDRVDAFGLKAFKAAQEARTFSDVIDSVKDAASTGFMNTFELLIGNYVEATKVYTDMANALYDVFAEPINQLNEFLDNVLSGEGGKRTEFLETLANIGSSLIEIWNLVVESLRNVWEFNGFLPATVEQVKNIIDRIKEFTQSLVLSDNYLREKLEKTLTGVFATLHIGWSVIKRIGKYIGKAAKRLAPVVDIVLAFTAGVGDFFRILDNSISKIGFFNTFIGEGERVLVYAKIALNNFRRMLAATFTENPKAKKFYEDHKAIFDGLYKIATTVYEKIKEPLKKIPELLRGFADDIKTRFSNFKMPSLDLDALSTSIDELRRLKNDLLGIVSDKIDFSGFITGFDFTVAENFGRTVTSLDFWRGVLDGVIAGLASLGDTLKNVDWAESVKTFFIIFSDVVHSILTNAESLAKDLVRLFGAIMGILYIYQTYNLYKAIIKFVNNLSSMFGLMSILSGIGAIFKRTSEYIKSLKWKNYAEAFLGFAGGVAIIGATLYILATQLDWTSWNVIAPVAFIGVVMFALYKLAQTMSAMDIAKFEGAAGAFLGFAAAIGILGLSLKYFADFTADYKNRKDDILGAFILIISLTTILASAAVVMGRFAPQFTKGAIGLIPMVLALRLLIKPLQDLTEWIGTVGDANAGEGIAFLTAIMLGLAGMVAVMNNSSGGFWKSMGNVAVIAAAVSGMTKIVKTLSNLSVKELSAMKSSAKVIGGLMLVLGGILVALGLTDWHGESRDTMAKTPIELKSLKTSNLTRAASALNAMIFGLTLVGAVIFSLSKFGNVDAMLPIAGTLGLIMAGLTVMLIALAQQPGIERAMAPLLAMAGCITVLGLVIAGLAWVSSIMTGGVVGSIIELVIMIGTIGATLGLLASKTDPETLMRTAQAIGIVSLATLAIGAALRLMSGGNIANMAASAGAMVLTLVTIAVGLEKLTDAIKFGGSAKELTYITGAMVVMMAALNLVAASYKIMQGISWQNVLASMIALNVTMGVMAGVLYLLSKNVTGNYTQVYAAIGVMSLSLVAIAGAFKIMDGMNLQSTWENAKSLALIFGAIAVAIGILGAIGGSVAGFDAAIVLISGSMLAISVAMVIMSGALYLFAAAVEKLTQNESIDSFGDAIGSMADGVTRNAPRVAQALITLLRECLRVLTENWDTILGAVIFLIGTTFTRSVNAIVAGIRFILTTLRDNVEDFVTMGSEILLGFLRGINSHLEEIIEEGCNIAINVMNGIADKAPEMIESAANLLLSFVEGITAWVSDPKNQERVGDDIVNLVEAAVDMITAVNGKLYNYIKEKFKDIGPAIWQGLKSGLAPNLPKIDKDGHTVADVFIAGVENAFGIESPSKEMARIGGFLIAGLDVGIRDNTFKAEKAAENSANGVLGAMRNAYDTHSPSEKTIKIAEDLVKGLCVGLKEKSKLADDVATWLAENNITNISDAYAKGKDYLKSKISGYLSEATGGITDDFDLSNLLNSEWQSAIDSVSFTDYQNELSGLTSQIDMSAFSIDDYTSSLNTADYSLDSITDTQHDWISELESNGPIIDKTTASINQLTDAYNDMGYSTQQASENMGEYTKVLTKITDVSQGFYADKLAETVEDYVKLANADSQFTKDNTLMDFVEMRQKALGVQGMKGLLESIQDDWNAGIKMQLFTDKDIPFIDFVKERTRGFGTDKGYYENIHIVPIDPNAYVDEGGFVTTEAVAQGVADGMTTAAQNGYGYSQINYTGHLNEIIRELNATGTRVASIFERLDKLQVVLDTGVIAGAVSPNVDQYIGNKTVLAGRGVS